MKKRRNKRKINQLFYNKKSFKMDNEEFNDKFNEVSAILDYLSEKYGVQYVLNMTDKEKNDSFIMSENLVPDKIDDFVDTLLVLQNEMTAMPEYISKGGIAVRCLDNTNKPQDIGDWPELDRVYVVDSVLKTMNGWSYKLQGMNTTAPYVGYSTKRFVIVMDQPYN